jgi:hypothetical protein
LEELTAAYRRVVPPVRTYIYLDALAYGRWSDGRKRAAIDEFAAANRLGPPIEILEDATGSVFDLLFAMVSRPSEPGTRVGVVVVVYEVAQLRGRLGELLAHADVYDVKAGRRWRRGTSPDDTPRSTALDGHGAVGVPDSAARFPGRLRKRV